MNFFWEKLEERKVAHLWRNSLYRHEEITRLQKDYNSSPEYQKAELEKLAKIFKPKRTKLTLNDFNDDAQEGNYIFVYFFRKSNWIK